MHKAVVIANPRGGRSRRKFDFTEVAMRLQRQGLSATLTETTHAGHATEIARLAVSEGADPVVVCGGDGTLRDVTAGMLGSNAVMLPLATGTTNVIAAGLGLRGDPLSIVDQIDALEVRTIDVGLCGDRPFLMQASAGLDAVVMTEVRQEMKQRFGMLAVAMTGLRCWLRYGFPEIRVAIDGVEPGQNLASRFKTASPGVWEYRLAQAMTALPRGTLTVSVRDRQGNATRIVRAIAVIP